MSYRKQFVDSLFWPTAVFTKQEVRKFAPCDEILRNSQNYDEIYLGKKKVSLNFTLYSIKDKHISALTRPTEVERWSELLKQHARIMFVVSCIKDYEHSTKLMPEIKTHKTKYFVS